MRLRRPLVTVLIVAALGLSACGGGSGERRCRLRWRYRDHRGVVRWIW